MAKKSVWSDKVGRDAVSLDTALCRWLGKRLAHLAKHTGGVPVVFINENPQLDEDIHAVVWRSVMATHAENLLAYAKLYDAEPEESEVIISRGRDAMHWVAKWLPHLWD